MDWLSDFADTQSMERLAEQAAASKEVLDASDDLDAFFDRIGDDDLGVRDDDEPSDVDHEAGIAVRSGLPTIEVPGLGEVSDALDTGADVPAEDVEAWMGALLDQGSGAMMSLTRMRKPSGRSMRTAFWCKTNCRAG